MQVDQAKLSITRQKLNIQLETSELIAVAQALNPPMNFLVFGAGNDSILWAKMNNGGRTVFLEDDVIWIKNIRQNYPFLEIHHIEYNTQVEEWRNLIDHPIKLHLRLPKDIQETKWDIILVDGPAGYTIGKPGRMKSIYVASQLGKPGSSVFIHDSERDVEKEYGEKYLGKENVKQEIWGRALMREYIL